MKISSILSSKHGEVITAAPGENLADAVARLAQHNIGALIVVDDDASVVGIISERDIVRVLAERADALDLVVETVMTRQVVVGVPEDDVMSVAHTMTERRFRHLPVVDKGRLMGIISIGDVLKAQRDKYRGEIDTLETQIMADDTE